MKTGPLLAAALVLASAGCGDSGQETLLIENATSQTRFSRDAVMTMAAGVLDDIELDGGMVIVPSDEAIFSLDADALADLLAGGLTELVASSVISTDHGSSMEEWPGELGDGSGPPRAVTRTGDTWSVDGRRVVDVWRRDGVTVIVIDGILDR